MEETLNWKLCSDPQFKENNYRPSKVMQEGEYGRQLQIFFDGFYGEGYEVKPGHSFTRTTTTNNNTNTPTTTPVSDSRPFAGVVWAGSGNPFVQ